jgi:hypothetical protein
MRKKNRLLRIFNLKPKEKKKVKTSRQNQPENKKQDLSTYNYKCGQRNITLSVQKIQLLKDPQIDSVFYYACAFCVKDFDAQTTVCPDCGKPLTKINLKKCPGCGAKNKPPAKTCWVCSAPFPPFEVSVQKEERLLLALNIDGNIYRNTDPALGLGMKKLFEDLIAGGFSKEPLDTWIKFYEDNLSFKKDMFRQECKSLAQESRKKDVNYFVIFIIVVGIGILIFRVFWSN